MSSTEKNTDEFEQSHVENSQVSPEGLLQETSLQENDEENTELPEDMEMIGPGQILSEGRKKLGLTQENVAKTLNFRLILVNNIEMDNFDASLPDTFNKGYLRSYAKLVKVDAGDVLASYEALGAADIQRTEMQSFSNLVVKQAEHSRIMWVSYLIIAILIGSTVMWWIQDNQQHDASQKRTINEVALNKASASEESSSIKNIKSEPISEQRKLNDTDDILTTNIKEEVLQSTIQQQAVKPKTVADTLLSTAVFTFSGDCWVNIYDSNKERIAWGIKKQGYVMTVTGKPPLQVTLGKPELATIVFNGETVDMSPYNAGNIAKFTLPITP